MSVMHWLAGTLFGTGRHGLEEFGVNELLSMDDLDAALEMSEDGVIAIFKHSTTCPVSAGAYRQVAAYLEHAGDDAPPFFLVKVIESRPVSNEIASRLSVTHQSPQIILVQDAKALWNASHGAITEGAISGALEKPRG
jgi:bacillithiol system protein YtxJ